MITRADKDILLWKEWKKNPSIENRKNLLKALEPIIISEVFKQAGTIPPPILKLKAKNLVLKALPKYDPSKSKLSTFVVHQLAPLKRENMKAQNLIRMPENLQLKVRSYLDARMELEEKLNREPTALELSDHMKLPLAKVTRLEKQFHKETTRSSLAYDAASPKHDSGLNLKVDLVYRSLNPRDKLIFEYMTGYGGKPKLSNNEVAKKLKVSAAFISQRKNKILLELKKAGV